MACSHSTLNDAPVIDPRPELPADVSAADSLVEALELANGGESEPLQIAND